MSMSQHVREIVSKDGIIGLWKGTSTTVTRAVILGSAKLATYDEIKVQLNRRLHLDPKGLSSIITASIGTGLVVALVSAPADFARTRYMTSHQMAKQTGLPVQYSSGLDVIRQVVRKEGVLAVYKGIGPQWGRIAPYSVIQFLACMPILIHFTFFFHLQFFSFKCILTLLPPFFFFFFFFFF